MLLKQKLYIKYQLPYLFHSLPYVKPKLCLKKIFKRNLKIISLEGN